MEDNDDTMSSLYSVLNTIYPSWTSLRVALNDLKIQYPQHTFTLRSSESIATYNKKTRAIIRHKPIEFEYHEWRMTCMYGEYRSRSKGIRKRKQEKTNCPMKFIATSSSRKESQSGYQVRINYDTLCRHNHTPILQENEETLPLCSVEIVETAAIAEEVILEDSNQGIIEAVSMDPLLQGGGVCDDEILQVVTETLLPLHFNSWDDFQSEITRINLHHFHQLRIRSSTSIEKYNARIKTNDGIKPITWNMHAMVYQCTHGIERRSRGTGKRKHSNHRYTNCPVRIEARSEKLCDDTEDEYTVRIVKQCSMHNHSVGDEEEKNMYKEGMNVIDL